MMLTLPKDELDAAPMFIGSTDRVADKAATATAQRPKRHLEF
jgi:hypothetical protein